MLSSLCCCENRPGVTWRIDIIILSTVLIGIFVVVGVDVKCLLSMRVPIFCISPLCWCWFITQSPVAECKSKLIEDCWLMDVR